MYDKSLFGIVIREQYEYAGYAGVYRSLLIRIKIYVYLGTAMCVCM